MTPEKAKLAVELAAKVRGYFTNQHTGKPAIDEMMDGDQNLYDIASKITKKVIQPGKK